MSQDAIPIGPRPPQQARSRAALARILTSAEQVLLTDGFDNFTMARVAQLAGVSVGAVYRRFTGKDQLLDAVRDRMLTLLEENLAESLRAAVGHGLGAVVQAYTTSLAQTYAAGSRVYLSLLGHTGTASTERAVQARQTIQRLFLDAASVHQDEIAHPDAEAALVITARTIVGACIHRVASLSWQPEITWESWQAEVARMGTLYLTTHPPEPDGALPIEAAAPRRPSRGSSGRRQRTPASRPA